MAKATSTTKKQNKIDVNNLTERDRDILTMEVPEAMKKYNLGKQGVYDRRFALNRKLKEAGLTLQSALNGHPKEGEEPAKEMAAKKVREVKAQKPKQEEVKVSQEEPAKETDAKKETGSAGMKPIEINFESFSIRLNGLPKQISINPETNAIEIDL